jgi:transposase InsO family protein
MRSAGLQGVAARRWKKTTIADPAAATRVDRIRRDFTTDANRLNSRWCGDITYIHTWKGWLFLATVIDIASAVSWAPPAARRATRRSEGSDQGAHHGIQQGARSAVSRPQAVPPEFGHHFDRDRFRGR